MSLIKFDGATRPITDTKWGGYGIVKVWYKSHYDFDNRKEVYEDNKGNIYTKEQVRSRSMNPLVLWGIEDIDGNTLMRAEEYKNKLANLESSNNTESSNIAGSSNSDSSYYYQQSDSKTCTTINGKTTCTETHSGNINGKPYQYSDVTNSDGTGYYQEHNPNNDQENDNGELIINDKNDDSVNKTNNKISVGGIIGIIITIFVVICLIFFSIYLVRRGGSQKEYSRIVEDRVPLFEVLIDIANENINHINTLLIQNHNNEDLINNRNILIDLISEFEKLKNIEKDNNVLNDPENKIMYSYYILCDINSKYAKKEIPRDRLLATNPFNVIIQPLRPIQQQYTQQYQQPIYPNPQSIPKQYPQQYQQPLYPDQQVPQQYGQSPQYQQPIQQNGEPDESPYAGLENEPVNISQQVPENEPVSEESPYAGLEDEPVNSSQLIPQNEESNISQPVPQQDKTSNEKSLLDKWNKLDYIKIEDNGKIYMLHNNKYTHQIKNIKIFKALNNYINNKQNKKLISLILFHRVINLNDLCIIDMEECLNKFYSYNDYHLYDYNINGVRFLEQSNIIDNDLKLRNYKDLELEYINKFEIDNNDMFVDFIKDIINFHYLADNIFKEIVCEGKKLNEIFNEKVNMNDLFNKVFDDITNNILNNNKYKERIYNINKFFYLNGTLYTMYELLLVNIMYKITILQELYIVYNIENLKNEKNKYTENNIYNTHKENYITLYNILSNVLKIYSHNDIGYFNIDTLMLFYNMIANELDKYICNDFGKYNNMEKIIMETDYSIKGPPNIIYSNINKFVYLLTEDIVKRYTDYIKNNNEKYDCLQHKRLINMIHDIINYCISSNSLLYNDDYYINTIYNIRLYEYKDYKTYNSKYMDYIFSKFNFINPFIFLDSPILLMHNVIKIITKTLYDNNIIKTNK